MKKKVVVIGAGFAGLSAAAFMAREGWSVTLVDRHPTAGGRARQHLARGFTFDMGPSWYWMPEVFERFFAQFGKNVADQYSLTRLDPSYRVYWNEGHDDIPASIEGRIELFESIEPGSGQRLMKYLQEAGTKYRIGMQELVYRPGLSVREFMDPAVLMQFLKLDVISSIRKHVARHFKSPKLRQLMEFPILFLGALPQNTPALYSLMNHADIAGGTWFPQGGMYAIVQAMQRLCEDLGVQFRFKEDVMQIGIENGRASRVITDAGEYEADVVISGADYHFTESKLLSGSYRSYTEDYWDSRKLAPSCLLYYVGLEKKISDLQHHSLFFDVPFEQHANQIHLDPEWPREPLFHLCAPSRTDPHVAPEGCENLVFLIPVAAGLYGDTQELQDRYFDVILQRLEERSGQRIREHIVYRKSYSGSDLQADHNAYKGNAYGLANTLSQTAILRPSCKSRKVANLYYTGQFTVPGPGVPPSLISGEVVSNQVILDQSR